MTPAACQESVGGDVVSPPVVHDDEASATRCRNGTDVCDAEPKMVGAIESDQPIRSNVEVWASLTTAAQYQPAASVWLIVASIKPVDAVLIVPASNTLVPGSPVVASAV